MPLQFASIGFEKGIINNPANIVAGFKSGGIWSVSFFHRCRVDGDLFHSGGVDSTGMSIATWITTREVTRNEILSLPPNVDRTRKRRKTLDVNNMLKTHEDLNKYDD